MNECRIQARFNRTMTHFRHQPGSRAQPSKEELNVKAFQNFDHRSRRCIPGERRKRQDGKYWWNTLTGGDWQEM